MTVYLKTSEPNLTCTLTQVESDLTLQQSAQDIQTITIRTDSDPYEGRYEWTPSFDEQIIETAGKNLERDITVYAIPVSVTSNHSGGNTVYIGGIFNG